MFYKRVWREWLKGTVRIGLPADEPAGRMTIEAPGLTGLLAGFLSKNEKMELLRLAREDAESAAANKESEK